MTTLPYVFQASPDTHQFLSRSLNLLAETLEDLKIILATEGLYAPDGTLGIENGSLSVEYSRDSKTITIRNISDDIPF